jgi:hypothetical protein
MTHTPPRPPPPAATDAPPWHARSAEEALQAQDSRTHGLSGAEAQARLARHGPNRLAEVEPPGLLQRLARQFNNLLLYVLMAAALVTALMGHWVDTGVIMAVVVLNAVIGFVQEGKAEKALQAIRHMLSPHAVVLRDGPPARHRRRRAGAGRRGAAGLRRQRAGRRAAAAARATCASTNRRSPASRCRWTRTPRPSRPAPPSATACAWPTPARW